jgi:hypothetical protein
MTNTKTMVNGKLTSATPLDNRMFRDAWVLNEDVIEIDVEKAKPIAIEKINDWRDKQKELPFTVDGVGEFSADADSKANIDGAAQAALMAKLGGQPFSINWSLHDDSEITLDADQMQAVGLGLMAHINTAHTTARGYKDQVRAATDMSQIEAVLNSLS